MLLHNTHKEDVEDVIIYTKSNNFLLYIWFELQGIMSVASWV